MLRNWIDEIQIVEVGGSQLITIIQFMNVFTRATKRSRRKNTHSRMNIEVVVGPYRTCHFTVARSWSTEKKEVTSNIIVWKKNISPLILSLS